MPAAGLFIRTVFLSCISAKTALNGLYAGQNNHLIYQNGAFDVEAINGYLIALLHPYAYPGSG
jgi:hypothetical protein